MIEIHQSASRRSFDRYFPFCTVKHRAIRNFLYCWRQYRWYAVLYSAYAVQATTQRCFMHLPTTG